MMDKESQQNYLTASKIKEEKYDIEVQLKVA